MNASLYDEVLEPSISIVNASELNDMRSHWAAYNRLRTLCHRCSGTEDDHPLQWEALGDFTSDSSVALDFYRAAISVATAQSLPEYEGSALLAMAERKAELGCSDAAWALAKEAEEVAEQTSNLDLRREIGEFLVSNASFT